MFSEEKELAKLNREWHKIMLNTYYVLDALILLAEVIITIILKGLGEDFRYSLPVYITLYIGIPTVINFGATTIGHVIVNKPNVKDTYKNHVLTYVLFTICFVLATVFNSYPVLLGTALVPMFVASATADKKFNKNVFLATLIGIVVSAVLSPIFNVKWSPIDGILADVIIIIMVILFYTLGSNLNRYARRKDAIVHYSAVENNRMRDELRRDLMTGLYNHSEFYTRITEYFTEPALVNRTVSIVILDVDNFKSINDDFGHVNGDTVLIAIARAFKQAVGEKGLAFRYGGEEFAAIFPNMDSEETFELCEELRIKISNFLFAFMLEKRLTVSMGIYTKKQGDLNADVMTMRADAALYKAKKTTKNRCVIYEEINEEVEL